MPAPDLLNALVSDVLATGDAAARVFLDRRMGCLGCAFAPFETLAEAAASHGLDAGELAESLLAAGVVVHPSKGSLS